MNAYQLLDSLPQTKLVDDSRKVASGSIFFAYPGQQGDGRKHIAEAVKRKAAAIIWEQDKFNWDSNWKIANAPMHDLREAAADLAAEYYGNPSNKLQLLAVTGTKGKTTVAWFISQLLGLAGKPTSYIGTLGIKSAHGELAVGEYTTPPALDLQRILAEQLKNGAKAVALEASSQGLVQGRLDALDCAIAIFTNLGRDHYDYHTTQQAYLASKQLLFTRSSLQWAIINKDDPNAKQLISACDCKVITVGQSAAEAIWQRTGIENGQQHCKLSFDGCEVEFALACPGIFNLTNITQAFVAACCTGVDKQKLADAISQLTLPAGRMQSASNSNTTVYVDYAHTPEALSASLQAVKEMHPTANLICVFGCGGDRDPGKRPLMGEAGSLANRLIITNDNPRSEDPEVIAAQIIAGVKINHQLILDRKQAIETAIELAGKDGVVLIAGKGHETTQIHANDENFFSDYQTAVVALKE